MLRSSVCCLGFIFFFWLSAFLSFGFLLIPFVHLLPFRSSEGPVLNLWAKKLTAKSGSLEQCKGMGNKCKREIQGGHYSTMKLYLQNRWEIGPGETTILICLMSCNGIIPGSRLHGAQRRKGTQEVAIMSCTSLAMNRNQSGEDSCQSNPLLFLSRDPS